MDIKTQVVSHEAWVAVMRYLREKHCIGLLQRYRTRVVEHGVFSSVLDLKIEGPRAILQKIIVPELKRLLPVQYIPPASEYNDPYRMRVAVASRLERNWYP